MSLTHRSKFWRIMTYREQSIIRMARFKLFFYHGIIKVQNLSLLPANFDRDTRITFSRRPDGKNLGTHSLFLLYRWVPLSFFLAHDFYYNYPSFSFTLDPLYEYKITKSKRSIQIINCIKRAKEWKCGISRSVVPR